MKIENAKALFFTDKQQYLNFKKAWSQAVNSSKTKSTYKTIDVLIWDNTKGYVNHPNHTTIRIKGWITPAHHLLYNILRECDYSKGFVSITNKTKLENGRYPEHALRRARYDIRYYIKLSKEYLEAQSDKQGWLNNLNKNYKKFSWFKKDNGEQKYNEFLSYRRRYVDEFLVPFAGTVTIEMISKIDIDSVTGGKLI